MTDAEIAQSNLTGHTLCLCKDGKILTSDKKGISPIIDFIDGGADLNGYCAADVIVGKAAALMFVKCGIVHVFAKILSQSGKTALETFGIKYDYEILTEKILNRAGDGACPMEEATKNTSDPNEAYLLIKKKSEELQKRQ